MGYRTILAELTSEPSARTSLPAARQLAGRFEAVLVGFHAIAAPFIPAAWEGGGSVYLAPELIEAQRDLARGIRDRVEAVFREHCGADSRAVWREAEGEVAQLLAAAARTADLVITTQGGRPTVSEPLVTAAGVPVLVLPSAPAGELGRRVLVGWNGSREATRAAHQALPFLAGAERVFLCALGQAAHDSLEPATTMLGRHGVAVEPIPVAAAEGAAGRALLEQAREHGADLLVVGAYGHSRMREFIFGGATRHLLDQAELPVLFGT